MNQFIQKGLTYLVLLSSIIFVYTQQITLAHAIMLFPIFGLAGFNLYLNFKEQPDYRKLYEDKMNDIHNSLVEQIKQRDEFYERKIQILEGDVAKFNISAINNAKKSDYSNYRF